MDKVMDSVGLGRGDVTVAPPDPRWADAFTHVAAIVGQALGERALAVEHVGSTAVPALPAKPIIDVAVAVPDDLDVSACVTALVRAGLEDRGDQGGQGGWLFVLGEPNRRVAHVHVVREHEQQWANYLRFRDRLRDDAQIRAEYAALKRSLATRFPRDRAAYSADKGDFIRRALATRG